MTMTTGRAAIRRLLAAALLLLGGGASLSGCGSEGAGASGDELSDVGPATPSDALGAADLLVPPPPGAEPPVLDDAAARIGGRHGADIALVLSGSDPNRDAVALVVRATNGGAETLAFDVVRDGVADAAETVAVLPTDARGKKTFEATIRFRDLAERLPAGSELTVALVDATGLRSAALTATVAAQPERSVGESCDPASILDRCPASQGCTGDPAVCAVGVAPEITRIGYVALDDEARVLIEGTEPDDDLKSILLEFFGSDGSPVDLDLDSDGLPDANSFVVEADQNAVGSEPGSFVIALQTAGGIEEIVASMAATPRDVLDQVGERVEVELATAHILGNGKPCDPVGFEVCQANSVCAPGIVGASNRCASHVPAQKDKCDDAPTLTPTAAGQLVAYLPAVGSSLWEPPEGCASGDPQGLAEAVVSLRLDEPAARLTLTTDLAGTDVDTVLYVLPEACPRQALNALGCNDDNDRSVASTLELEDVPTGDYLVVIDAWDTGGGGVALGVTIEP